LITSKKKKYGTVTKPTLLPLFEYKKRDDSGHYCYLFNPVQAKDAGSMELVLKQAEALSNAWTS